MKELGETLAYYFHDLAVFLIEYLWPLCVCNLDDSVHLRLIVDNWTINTILDIFGPFHRIRCRHLLIHHKPIDLWTEITCLCHISFRNRIWIPDHLTILIHWLNRRTKHAYNIVLAGKLRGLE